MVHARTQPNASEQIGRAALRLRRRDTANAKRHHDVFERGELAQQVVVLEHEPDLSVADSRELVIGPIVDGLATDEHVTSSRPIQRTDHVQQSALPSAALADNGDHFPSAHSEVDPIEDV
jgi:hypothetical protein